MLKLALIIISLAIAISVYFVFLTYTAKPPQIGLENEKLSPCPGKPNCVNSDHPGDHGIAPIMLPTIDATDNRQRIVSAIAQTGGVLKISEGGFFHAEYRSRIYRFVDDLELRIDEEQGVIHVKSASRSGTSDLGVNRKRVENLRDILSR